MKTKALALLCALVMLLTAVVVALPVQAAVGDTVYIRKHISLLYDNSGSMSMDIGAADNLRWCYASYAAQVFTGLLNDTDSLSFTFMNGVGGKSGIKTLAVDLAADRQKQVNKVLNNTNYASGGTPFDSITDAHQALVKKGLLSNDQIGTNQAGQGEQFWLVLTTDGNFYDKNNKEIPRSDVVKKLQDLLSKYSNMQMVYFGIGTKGDNSENVALDLRNEKALTAYSNFTAVYAEEQTEIVSTMRTLANRISGRYSVSNDIKQDGKKVTIRISSETSPIRNVAVLAQNTTAKLVSATTDTGVRLTVSRPATIQYPTNSSYDNLPKNTKGGSTALIINPDGKLPPGNITLEFSEAVSLSDLSLMYEPAICVDLTLQRQDASGEWVDVPYGEKVLAEQQLRVNYLICEDGTDTPIDASKLPGATTAQISCGGQPVEVGKPFQLKVGASTITATVSMMDGNYVVSTSRNVTALSLSAYTYEISPALEFYPNDLATNSSQYIDFKIFYEGSLATADQLTDFRIEAGDLKGLFTTPSTGVYRFTPQDDARPIGEYVVTLKFQNHVVATQTVRVKEEELSYTAEAGDALALYTNETADNQNPVIFTVTKHLGETNSLLVKEEMGDFRIEAVSADGNTLKGEVKYVADGQIHFIVKDDVAVAGEYAVNLYWKDSRIAQGQISVLQYNAVYTAEVFPVGGNTVDRFHLMENENGLAFVVYADGEALTANQLQAMLNQQKIVYRYSPESDVMEMAASVGEHDGKPALVLIPTTKTKWSVWYFLQKPFIALGSVKLGTLDVTMDVQAVYGTSVSGSMEITNNFAEWLAWLISFLVILTLVACISWIVYCNIRMPRIAPGTFQHVKISITDTGATVTKSPKKKHRVKWYFFKFTLLPEEISYKGQTFCAVEDCKDGLRCPTSPQIWLRPNDPHLYNFYRSASAMDAGNLMALMKGSKCKKADVLAITGRAAAIVKAKDKPTKPVPGQINSGEFLMKRIGLDGRTIHIWYYQQNSNS